MSDTIFALSSGALPAAIAVIRVSGPEARAAAEQICGPLGSPRSLPLRGFKGLDGDIVDRGLVVYFPGPTTVTGEDVVEFHCHGGRAVVARMQQLLESIPGLRLAQAGEFTRRALLNGRLDLTQAEGLADLLSAETEWQRRAALANAGGDLGRQVEQWRNRLVFLAAEAEAAIDYVDEEETELDLTSIGIRANVLAAEWRVHLDRPRVELLNDGLKVVLAGPPNTGKSSLFNAIIGYNKAIVTEVPGTTRDLVELPIDLDGRRLILIDTAGVRESDDQVEQIGVQLARRASVEADVLVWLGSPMDLPDHPAAILVHSRCDVRLEEPPAGSIATSIKTGAGLSDLRQKLLEVSSQLLPSPDHAGLNRRQARALDDARISLEEANTSDILLFAEGLRQALLSLDELTGRQSTEDVLDALFGRFCLGK